MQNPVRGIDRILIAVADIDTATREYSVLLGVEPFAHGQRSTSGARSVLFRLDNTCLELRATDGEEGLSGLVFEVGDIEGFAAQVRAEGVALAELDTGYDIDAVSGVENHWRQFPLPPQLARGIALSAIQYDAALAESATPVLSGDGLRGVDHVVINTVDGDAAAALYGDTLGIRLALRQDVPKWGGDMLFFRTSHMSIEVIAADTNDAQRDSLWGIAFKVGDIMATHTRLVQAGVAVSDVRDGRKPGTRVCTIKSHCCAIPTLLVQAEPTTLKGVEP